MTLPPLPTAPVILIGGAATSPGNRRSHNEDAFACGASLAAVADGIGGHAAGEVASGLAIETLISEFAGGGAVSEQHLRSGIDRANRAILARARRDSTPGMGTTLVAAVAGSAGVLVAHAGDSRCYRLLGGALELVTTDHSLVVELVAAGRLTAEAAAGHRLGNVVTRALGTDDEVQPDIALLGSTPCRLLLCSDGLSNELAPQAIGRVLSGIADPSDAAHRLVQLTLAGPARDNVTAVVVDIVPPRALDVATGVSHDGGVASLASPAA